MNRREFSVQLAKQIQFTNETLAPLGYWCVIDYVLRSAQEQKRLFDTGKSECDGIHKISRHQLGKAADLYVIGVVDGKEKLVDQMEVCPDAWRKVRLHWESLGGSVMIPWDKGHFE